jgi:hypothetical protein
LNDDVDPSETFRPAKVKDRFDDWLSGKADRF